MRATANQNVLEVLEANAKLLRETIATSKRIMEKSNPRTEEKLKDLEEYISFLKLEPEKRAYLHIFEAGALIRSLDFTSPEALGSIGLIETTLQVMEGLVSDGK